MKRCIADFSVCGGVPVFDDPLAVGRPNMPDRESFLSRVDRVLDSGQITNDGPMVRDFESQIGSRLRMPNVVAVCNGTMALQIMCVATGLTGEVIVPSLTFIATAHALQWIGLTPVFADVDPLSHTLDPASVERCINDRTSAILGVHLWGNKCDVAGLQRIADRRNLQLLFDASHAFGCRVESVPIGHFGTAEAFSFHATKALQSVEGGAIVSRDDCFIQRCRLLRNFGITGFAEIDSAGTNGKMNELCAAAGLSSLEKFDEVVVHNRNLLAAYRRMVGTTPGIDCMAFSAEHETNAQYVVMCVEQSFGLSRDQLLKVLRAEGVFARSYFVPGCHNAPPYRGQRTHSPVELLVTNRLLDELIQLPTGSNVTIDDVAAIADLFQAIHRHSSELKAKLQSSVLEWHPSDPARPIADNTHREAA